MVWSRYSFPRKKKNLIGLSRAKLFSKIKSQCFVRSRDAQCNSEVWPQIWIVLRFCCLSPLSSGEKYFRRCKYKILVFDDRVLQN